MNLPTEEAIKNYPEENRVLDEGLLLWSQDKPLDVEQILGLTEDGFPYQWGFGPCWFHIPPKKVTVLEIISVDSQYARLTVTPNRVTLKLPKTLSEEETNTLQGFTIKILNNVLPVTQSWRGSFKKNEITLYNDSKKENKQFKY